MITATDYAFGAPDTIAAGLTTLRMANVGREPHQAGLVRIDSGKTTADIVTGLRAIAPPPWMVFVGGPDVVAPGDTSNATQWLRPGAYWLVCFFPSADGKMHLEKGMLRPLVVKGPAPAADAEPAGDVAITLNDYGFEISAPLSAGAHAMRAVNAGPQLHEVMVLALAPGKSLTDVQAWAAGGMKGTPPARPLGGIVALSKGEQATFTVTLAPGNYLLACFVTDAKDGKPHLMHGMAKQIKVT